MNNERLLGAIILIAGACEAWHLIRSLDSGKWRFWLMAGGVPILIVDRRYHPIAFWFCVAWDAFAMIFLVALGTWAVAPLVRPMLG